MKNSIFKKYFSACCAVILLNIIILGVMLLGFATQYFKEEQAQLLEGSVEKAASVVSLNYKANDYAYLSGDMLQNYLNASADAIKGCLFLTDKNGNLLLCSDATSTCPHQAQAVPQDILKQARQTHYYRLGTLGGIYSTRHFTAGTAIMTDRGQLFGYVFSSTPATAQNAFLINILQMFAVAAIIVILITLIITYFATYRMIKPLKEMSIVAQKYGSGEFDARVGNYGDNEIGQLAVSLNNMGQSLAVQESTTRSFIANVSHELKTPMTSISGFIDGILDGTIPPEQHKQYLEIVSNEVQRLSRMVRSMLNLARIEAGELKLATSKFDMVDTICQTVFSFEKSIEAKQLDIHGLDHEPVLVVADNDLMHQVIYNLTENAVKFANPGGYIQFGFHCDATKTYISIKNSGQGLTKEELPFIFDKFYKTDKSRGLDKSGVGLGLYIVKTILNLHNGDIFVSSTEGEYTEFVFCLPSIKPKKFHTAVEKSKQPNPNQ